ncbi:MAG: type II secretion system protein GspG, partial [Chromatiaceae bacterium]
ASIRSNVSVRTERSARPRSGFKPLPSNWRGPYLRKAVPPDPWGNPYKYLNIQTAKSDPSALGKVRKDRSLHPLSSDYDLYSMGADGRSAPALTAQVSRDDIVRARNGEFVDLALNY